MSSDKQMSAADARIAFRELQKEIGLKARIYVSLAGEYGEQPLSAQIYFNDRYSGGADLSVEGSTFEELLSAAQTGWAEHKDRHKRETITKLALAIIRITDDQGSCSDAALRLEFDRNAVENWGAEACARADQMAGRGPFSIEVTADANRPLMAAE